MYLFLIVSTTSLCNNISDTYIDRGNLINDNLILVLRIQVSINFPRVVFISIFILSAFRVFVWGFKAKFVLNRYITNHLKKITEGEKVFAFDWELAELVE